MLKGWIRNDKNIEITTKQVLIRHWKRIDKWIKGVKVEYYK